MFLYERIARELRERIERREYPTGRLPAERALSEEFSVQRDTIRRALEELTVQNVLIRDSTRGTYVAPRYAFSDVADVPGGPSAPRDGVLLIVQTFEDMLAPSSVFRGLSQRLAKDGVPTYWYDPGEKTTGGAVSPAERFLPPASLLVERGIHGVVIWPRLPMSLEALRSLRTSLPLVLIDRRIPNFEADFVGFQDFEAGRTITEHLLSLGRRRIGFVTGEVEATSVQARLAGYFAALEAAGIERDPALILHQEGGSRFLDPAVVSGFLAGGRDPLSGVVCANDTVAARMIQFARSFDRRVPDDVAVTGFGDLMPSMMDIIGITTVAQAFDKIGEVAGDLLLERMNGGAAASPVREIELPMRLVVRESSGGAPPAFG